MSIISKLSTKLNSRFFMGIRFNGAAQKYSLTDIFSRGLAQKRPSMEEFFEGKKFIVTGAGSGMGRVIAERLLQLDAQVIAFGKDVDYIQNTSSKITKITVDVSDWNQAFNEALKIGPVHGLVNNAGVAHIETFMDTTQHGWDDTLNVNCRGMVRVSQAVAKNMINEKIKGSIVNISSTISERAIPDHVAYCASKGAVNQITRTMAIELGPYGIRTNNVNPTVVLTEMGKKAWSDPKKSQPILDRISLGRFAVPDDIASATIFLLSDFSSMCNGLNLYVDGGFMTG